MIKQRVQWSSIYREDRHGVQSSCLDLVRELSLEHYRTLAKCPLIMSFRSHPSRAH